MDENKIENILKSITKTKVADFNHAQVRNQILDRISIPELVTQGNAWSRRFSAILPSLRMGTGILASLFIVASLTLATAVSALESVPGSTIYPLKKIVENVQLKLTPADKQAALQLKFANNRVEELQEVLDQKEEGKISQQQAETIIANTIKDLQSSATAATVSASKTPSKTTNIVNKLADISNKLRAASVQTEGQVKIELEKALESTQISQEEAIKNLEQAGLKVENSPIIIADSVTASGKLTAVSATDVSIGTAKFLITTNTVYENIKAADLKAGLVVDIDGQIKDNKAYAVKITLKEIKTETIEAQSLDETP